jgi:hypothetical protein
MYDRKAPLVFSRSALLWTLEGFVLHFHSHFNTELCAPLLQLQWEATGDMIANGLEKALSRQKLSSFTL